MHIESSVCAQMCAFLEITHTVIETKVTNVCEVDSAFQHMDGVDQVIAQVCSVGTGTESNTVVFVRNHFHHTFQVCLSRDDTRQTEYAPGRIVRMDCHVDIVLVTYRHDRFQEVFQVVQQFVIVDVFVQLEQLFYFLHTLRLPARHDGTVHVILDAGEHGFRIHAVDLVLAVSENGGSVCSHTIQFCSCPVEYRHEVVANHVNISFSKVFQCFDVSCDIFVALRSTCLDGIADINALNTCQMKACILNFFLHCQDLVQCPYLSRHFVVKSCDDSLYIAALTNLLQSYGIVVFAVPAHCHFHSV